jgi:hypothetical protein
VLGRKVVPLGAVRVVVVDEADRMLDMGFRPQVTRILEHVPTNRQDALLGDAERPRGSSRTAVHRQRLEVSLGRASSARRNSWVSFSCRREAVAESPIAEERSDEWGRATWARRPPTAGVAVVGFAGAGMSLGRLRHSGRTV